MIKTTITHITIVAPDGSEKRYENTIPINTDKQANKRASITVLKKLCLNCNAAMVGITIKAAIKKTPTILMDKATMTATMVINR